MAKDNLFLGTARGSVGDVVFSRLNGVQVSRVRNRAPRNPQSPAQMIQRIIMSTVGKAYSFLSPLCDHSFEGFETGMQSQRKFMEVNVAIQRNKLADLIAYPLEELVRASTAFNYSFKNDFAPVINQYKISAGTLPQLSLVQDDSGFAPVVSFEPGEATTQTITYGDIIRLLNLRQGDQLTFIQVTYNATAQGRDRSKMNQLKYARVILDPSDGDLTSPFLSANGVVNKPNDRNEGSFTTLQISATEAKKGLDFLLSGVSLASQSDSRLVGSAVIVSRLQGSKWLRSEQYLMPRSTQPSTSYNQSLLGLAYDTYRIETGSDLYLNQAE